MIQEKLNEVYTKFCDMEENLTGFRWALHRVENTVDTNQESLENFHRKLEHVKGAVNNNKDSLQKLHRNLEAVKGAVDSNQVSLRSAVNNNQNSLQRKSLINVQQKPVYKNIGVYEFPCRECDKKYFDITG
ncbi:uncharacterized protein LOC135206368 [Macrobrachium nipponense]|uniref:uncharacterized protein LOC135206368 n=1 Tax=Macrobrachium nipponense TaxID=159736 RepID=UPI0030C7D234